MKKIFFILCALLVFAYLAYLSAGPLYARTISDEKARRLSLLYGMCKARDADELESEEFRACVSRAKDYIARRDINYMLESRIPALTPLFIQPEFK